MVAFLTVVCDGSRMAQADGIVATSWWLVLLPSWAHLALLAFRWQRSLREQMQDQDGAEEERAAKVGAGLECRPRPHKHRLQRATATAEDSHLGGSPLSLRLHPSARALSTRAFCTRVLSPRGLARTA